MKISHFARLTGLLLVAGLFYSCSSTGLSVQDLRTQGNYEQALSEIEDRLSENPSQPSLYIQQAEINALLAKDEEPESRSEFYRQTIVSLDEATQYEASEKQLSTIDSLKQQLWKFEHNAGLRVSENEMATDRYDRAKTHFQNALIIRPDAISSYKNLSVAFYNMGDIDRAINALETALEYIEEPSSETLENLGYLYIEQGNPSRAANYYESANIDYSENPNTAFGLINAYIAKGDHEQAINLLEPLVEENPNNARLRNVYGTQLYEITSEILTDLEDAYRDRDTDLAEQIRFEAEGMGEEAEKQLIEAFKRDTTNVEYIESLAVFYNNLSAQYLSLKKLAFEDHKEPLEDKANTLITFAIDYFEKLVEVAPNNSEYQQKLDTLNKLINS